jgi:hypothetical protein
MRRSSAILLFTIILSFAIYSKANIAQTNDGIAVYHKQQFLFPSHMIPTADAINDFKAVSSHGRDEGLHPTKVSTTALFLRLVYLVAVFMPALSTSTLAYFSPSFRENYWFSLLTSSLANGGAVR